MAVRRAPEMWRTRWPVRLSLASTKMEQQLQIEYRPGRSSESDGFHNRLVTSASLPAAGPARQNQLAARWYFVRYHSFQTHCPSELHPAAVCLENLKRQYSH